MTEFMLGACVGRIGTLGWTFAAGLITKFRAAENRGASAILLVTPPGADDDRVGVDVALPARGGNLLVRGQHAAGPAAMGGPELGCARAREEVVSRAAARHREDLAEVELVLLGLLALPREVLGRGHAERRRALGHAFSIPAQSPTIASRPSSARSKLASTSSVPIASFR